MVAFSHLTEEQKKQLEVDNGFQQFDYAIEVIESFLDPERPFALRPSLIRELQAIAVRGIEQNPGCWRTGRVGISKSKHVPPEAYLVENLIRELCDFINDNWHEKTAFYLSSFIMWRLNWIHPFEDGNGRTSRVVSYIVLCTKLGYVLPGSPTIPQQIEENRAPYFEALEAADAAVKNTGEYCFTSMETLLKNMLAKQLLSVIHEADGNNQSD